MNYLVHLSLSYPYPEYLPGNFIFDILPREYKTNSHPFLRKGIQLHKRIDHFSNNHQAMEEINASFHPYVHKYAPVASDIVSDYLFYQLWSKYMTIDFNSFTKWTYSTLMSYMDVFPERMQQVSQKMIEHEWLNQYKSIEGIEHVLKRINLKLRFEGDLTKVLKPLSSDEKYYIELFDWFYSDMQKWNTEWFNLQSGMK